MQPRVARNGAQHKIVNLLKTLCDFVLWLCAAMYLMCGPKQLFFFQGGPEMQKGWTPLIVIMVNNTVLYTSKLLRDYILSVFTMTKK